MWPRLKNSPHTYAHEGLESIFLFEFIELQWVQTDFLRLSDNNIYKSHLPPFHNAFPADSGMSTQYLYGFHNYLHILIYIQKKLAFAFIIVYLCRKISGRLPSGQRVG